MGLSLSEAMTLTGKSRATLARYKHDGCDITDESSLRLFSDHADMRARGRAANLLSDRPTTSGISGPSFPGDSHQAMQALSIIEGLKTAFSKRLEKAKKISDETEVGMLEEELRLLTESHRTLDMMYDGYFGA